MTRPHTPPTKVVRDDALDLDAVRARYRYGSGDWTADFSALIKEVERLRERLHAAHDALTRITDVDDDVFATLESTVEYVVASWRAIAASEEQAADEVARLHERIASVESLCHAYTPEPPPLFRDPGLSEFGKGNNHGAKTLAEAVLGTLRGEPADDDACCAECGTGGGDA